MNYVLNEFQDRSLNRLLKMKSAVIALQPGLGKTLLSLHLSHMLYDQNKEIGLFVIPKSARSSFEKELRTKLCKSYKLLASDTTDDLSDAYLYEYVLIENTMVSRVIESLVSFVQSYPVNLFIDEAHSLQSDTSNFSKDMSRIRPFVKSCYSITASPLLNSIEGLFNLYHFTFPTVFKSWYAFRNRYCITQEKKFRTYNPRFRKYTEHKALEIVGYKNQQELCELLDKLTIKGAKEYNVDYTYNSCVLSEDLFERYRDASQGLLVTEDPKAFGARLHDLQRVVDGIGYDSYNFSKINKFKDILKNILSRNESTLVYFDYKESIGLIKDYLIANKNELQYNNLYIMTGEQKEDERVRIETSILPKDIVLISKAGRQSRNLQRANNIILYNIPFSIGDLIQLTGRVCRVDSKYEKQHIHIIYTVQTIDEYKFRLFVDHLALIKNLFGDEGSGTLQNMIPIEIDRMQMKAIKDSILWRKH